MIRIITVRVIYGSQPLALDDWLKKWSQIFIEDVPHTFLVLFAGQRLER